MIFFSFQCVWIKMIYEYDDTFWSMFCLEPMFDIRQTNEKITYVICNAFQSITTFISFLRRFFLSLDLNCPIAFEARSSFTFSHWMWISHIFFFSFHFYDSIRFVSICFTHCFLSLGLLVVLIVFVVVAVFRLMHYFNK